MIGGFLFKEKRKEEKLAFLWSYGDVMGCMHALDDIIYFE